MLLVKMNCLCALQRRVCGIARNGTSGYEIVVSVYLKATHRSAAHLAVAIDPLT